MRTKINIALNVSGANRPNRHFSLYLKQKLNSEPSEYRKSEKILAISDIEGNYLALLQLLVSNKVIDRHLKWIFEDGHLVIVGDCFDRGEQVVECLWLIYCLEEKARKKGGYVHFILGNHEIMNLNGDWRYVHPTYAQSLKTPCTALYYGNNELWQWLCTKNIMEKIGDLLFVHGGIARELLQFNLSVSEINDLVRPYYTRANESFTDPLLHSIFNSNNSPFWYRGFYHNPVTEEEINTILAQFNAKTIITGHTVVDEITPYFNGKVINLDTNHAIGKSEALLIRNDRFYRMDNKGNRKRIK